MNEGRSVILAIALSLGVLIGWQYLMETVQPPPEPGPELGSEFASQSGPQTGAQTPATPSLPATSGQNAGLPSLGAATPSLPAPSAGALSKATSAPRVAISTPSLRGSLSLKGALVDDLTLRKYRATPSPTSQQIRLFKPDLYYAFHGWLSKNAKMPDSESLWKLEEGSTLTPKTPIVLSYDNGEGLEFRRVIRVDNKYLFTITQTVRNTSRRPATLFLLGQLRRFETPETSDFFISHEGLVGVFNGELEEWDYEDIQQDVLTNQGQAGWLGITDKYWASVLIPPQGQNFSARFLTARYPAATVAQTRAATVSDYLHTQGVTLAPNQTVSLESHMFVGAKVVKDVDGYQKSLSLPSFDLLIDWGWFYFLTKPLFLLLYYFYDLLGNFGIAILVVTLLIKVVFFPLANKSYASMALMKKINPQLVKLRETYANDKMRQQQEMMALYKKEKVNPLAGCLPFVIQIPVFFALYKVLFVTIEMRHAPFFGWIQDLSAPDPTSLFNLFGLIPLELPDILIIGVWPLLMGISMVFQTRLNPPPPDPIQRKIFSFLPIIFTVILAGFPVGLVIYWTWNNILSIGQQVVIMRRHGVEIDVLDNLGLGRLKKAWKSKSS